MSRNKENNPLPQSRAVGSVFIGKHPTPPSAEFFTDSLLEDTSRIPSPSPLKNKNAVSKPRRAIGSKSSHVSRGTTNTARQSASLQNASSRGIRHQQPAPILQRPLSMRSSNSELITPPQSRDGLEAAKSPTSVESVPSRDLTDTYQRIYDEEELAATERESLSSEDDEGDGMEYAAQVESPSRAPRPVSNRNSWVHVESRTSKAATPEPLPVDADKENEMNDNTGSLSQDSGMSFLAQLTDKDLAAKMTPHMSERAKEKRRLQLGVSARPISFHAGTKPSEFLADDARSNASSERSSRSSRRRNLRLNSPIINGIAKAHSDTSLEGVIRPRTSPTAERKASSQPTRLQSPGGPREPLRPLNMPALGGEQQGRQSPYAEVSEDEGEETSAELRARERQFELNRAKKLFGVSGTMGAASGVSNANALGSFSAPERQHVTEEAPSEGGDAAVADGDDYTQSSIISKGSSRSESSVLRAPVTNRVPATNKGILKKWARTAAEQRADRPRSAISDTESSQVDWLDAAADVPLPSVEEGDCETKTDDMAVLRQKPSLDRFRRIENETTGMSFQVSESPPVKAKRSLEDITREKEIDRLSRQAVTKSRLEAIRERDPREAHRRLSRSASGASLRQSVSNDAMRLTEADDEAVGEQIPDTPVMVFRSSSGSSRSTLPGQDRPHHDRQSSHDALQRFARLSATPKSSPSITPKFEPSSKQVETEAAEGTASRQQVQTKKAPVTATPKVTGAWEDTMYPSDTIGTIKQKPQPKYVQTPHVTAGGWIDTPLPGTSQRPSFAPAPIDEVTEDLTIDLGQKPSTSSGAPNASAMELQQQPASASIGPSALSNILAAQRARIAGARGAAVDDTLNLGETTMASIEDLVDLNEEDVTTLIRLGAEHDALQHLGDAATAADGDQKEAEIVVLDRLAKKLHTLQANIRHARRAVGRFEREMSEGADEALATYDYQQPGEPSVIQQQQQATSPPALVRGTGVFPILYSTLTLPLPLFFHPASSSSTTMKRSKRLRPSIGRPTPLFYATCALLAYYLLEILLAELHFAHPLYAETYAWPPPAHGSEREPAFGFVLPTLLARGVGVGGAVESAGAAGASVSGVESAAGAVAGGVGGLARALGRAVEMAFGWGDGFGFVEEGTSSGAAAAAAATAAAGGGMGMDADGWSMMNDEML